MYDIAICDDDCNFIKYIEKMLLKSGLKKDEVLFCEYGSGEEMIKSLDAYEKIDLLILDMQMKELDGHETARCFREQFPSSVIVYCSGVCLPTVETFETTPFRYLLKEYTDEKMVQELKAVVQEVKNKYIEPSIIGTWKYSTVKLRLDEILYISIAKRGSNIYVNPKIIKYEFENHITSKKIVYADGKNGFGVYVVAFNDLDTNEMMFIAKSLREIFVFSKGIEKILAL